MAPNEARPRRRWMKWLIGGLAVLVVAAVAGPFIYINFISEDPKPRLQLSDVNASTTTIASESPDPSSTTAAPQDSVSVAGTWNVGSGSTAGYRVEEVLFGQNNTATGRTSDVSGTMTIDDTTLTEGEFTVELENMDSDEDRRDNQFRGRIMNVAEFPTAAFVLTEPLDFGDVPAVGEKVTVTANGDFTLHGTTKSIEVELEAQRTAARIEILGTVPIVFADYGIPNPSSAAISTEDHGEMEFLLVMTRA